MGLKKTNQRIRYRKYVFSSRISFYFNTSYESFINFLDCVRTSNTTVR